MTKYIDIDDTLDVSKNECGPGIPLIDSAKRWMHDRNELLKIQQDARYMVTMLHSLAQEPDSYGSILARKTLSYLKSDLIKEHIK